MAYSKEEKAAYDRAYRAKNAEKIRAAKKAYGLTDTKKAADQRWAEENRERSNAIKAAWKARNPTADHEYYLANTEKIKEREKARHAANPEIGRARTAAWTEADPARAKALHQRMYAENRGKYIIRARQRRQHIELRATPAWADKDAIAAIYQEAAARGMHVDHAIPLRGKNVCGLHVETNLQLLTPLDNRRKGNRYAGE